MLNHSFTDPESGITIQSNGSAAGDLFMQKFLSSYGTRQGERSECLKILRRVYDVVAVHPYDGWTNDGLLSIQLPYPWFTRKAPEVGDRIALEKSNNYYQIVTVTETRTDFFGTTRLKVSRSKPVLVGYDVR